MKKIAVSIILVLVLAGFWLYPSGEQRTVGSALHSEQLQSEGLEGYRMASYGESKIAGIDKTRIAAVNGTSRFEVDIYSDVSRGFAESFIQDRKNEITSMYTDKPAPYEGIPRRNVDCGKGYVVNITEISGGNYTRYSMYADESYNLGACSRGEVEYSAEVMVGYCGESRKLFESRSFIEEGSTSDHPRIICGE